MITKTPLAAVEENNIKFITSHKLLRVSVDFAHKKNGFVTFSVFFSIILGWGKY